MFNSIVPGRKIPYFHQTSCCGNFVEMHDFHRVSDKSPETLWKLCISTKFLYQEARWNYGILCSFLLKYFGKISGAENTEILILKEVMEYFSILKTLKAARKWCSPFKLSKTLRVIRKWRNPFSVLKTWRQWWSPILVLKTLRAVGK